MERGDNLRFFVQSEIFRIEFLPLAGVAEKLGSRRWKNRQVLQTLVPRKMGDDLCLKLRPIAPGNDRDLYDAEQGMQQLRRIAIDRHLALSQGPVQIEHHQS